MNTIVLGGRQKGKTTELIKMSAEKQIPILAMDRNRQRLTIKMAMDLGLNIPEPVLIKDIAPLISKDKRKLRIDNVIVDDSMELLRYLLSVNIEAAAVNTGDKVLEPITVVDLNKNNDSIK